MPKPGTTLRSAGLRISNTVTGTPLTLSTRSLLASGRSSVALSRPGAARLSISLSSRSRSGWPYWSTRLTQEALVQPVFGAISGGMASFAGGRGGLVRRSALQARRVVRGQLAVQRQPVRVRVQQIGGAVPVLLRTAR